MIAELLDPQSEQYESGADAVRHRWYTIKESFSPRFVETVCDSEQPSADDLVIDPFAGAGTVPLVAALRGNRAVGVEVNPFLAFVSTCKLSTITRSCLRLASQPLGPAILGGTESPLEGYSTFCRTSEKAGLFNREVLRGFEGGWQATNADSNGATPLLRLCLITAAMDVSNVVRDGKALRYRQSLLDREFDEHDLLLAFSRRLERVEEDLDHPFPGGHVDVRLGDSRKVLGTSARRRFKLCITSPPYLNSFDYSDVYRPELFLGKFVDSTSRLRAIRLQTLRSHVQVKWPDPCEDEYGPHFEICWKLLRERAADMWNARIPTMVQAYFEDMRMILKKALAQAAPDASLWMVISTSAYGGVHVPVDTILGDIAGHVGWEVEEIRTIRQLRSSGQHWRGVESGDRKQPPLRESLLVMRNTRVGEMSVTSHSP